MPAAQVKVPEVPDTVPALAGEESVGAPGGVVQAVLEEGRAELTEPEAKVVLASYGIPVILSKLAKSYEEVLEAAEELGYPVALKIVSPDVVHKSDSGGVRLNLNDPEEVREAYREIVGAYRYQHIIGVSVQAMAAPGVEAIIGVTRDANFGPVLMFGLGGIFVEVLKDHSAGLACE